MSQSVIFIVGIVVFAITVWGSVMAGGIWLGQLAESEDAGTTQKLVTAKPEADALRDAPDQR